MDDDRKKMMIEYKDILFSSYAKSMIVPKEFNKLLDLNNPITAFNWSTMRRLTEHVHRLHVEYTPPKNTMITTCFKVTRDASSCIIGYLHSEVIDNKTKHRYICSGSTYRSQDGEYRSRVSTWDYFSSLLDLYSEEFSIAEQLVVSKLESGEISFQVDICYPFESKANKREFEDGIDSSRLVIKLYMLCWFVDFHRIVVKSIPNHTNAAYLYIIYQPEDKDVYDSMVDLLGSKKYALMRERIESNPENVNDPKIQRAYPIIGQKIFPMSVRETVRIDDINYNVWRETYINILCSNLVLNFVTPSFPFAYGWFYIQNSHAGIFDNLSMHDKYLHSDIATNIAIKIKSADKLNYIGEDINRGAINSSFYGLSNRLNKDLLYIDSTIKLSDVCLCLFSENVGRTLRDLPTILDSKQYLPGYELIFTNTLVYIRHIFDFIYSFYCMNSKSFIIHGDIHMNNATIFRLFVTMRQDGHPYITKPHIIYVIDDDVYMFPHIGMFSCIIDFSRSIMGDREKIDFEFGPGFAEHYFDDQRKRIIDMMHHYFEEIIAKHGSKIYELLIENFPLMFKIISVIDTYVIMTNILGMFNIDDIFTQGRIKISEEIKEFTQSVIDLAYKLMVENLIAAIRGKIKNPDDIEWPNRVVINTIFNKFKITPEDLKEPDLSILDIFSYNNKLRYDIDSSEKFGPFLGNEEYNKLCEKYNLPKMNDIEPDNWKIIDDVVSRYDIKYATVSDDSINWMVE